MSAQDLAKQDFTDIVVAPGDGEGSEGDDGVSLKQLLESAKPGMSGGISLDGGSAPLQFNRKSSEHGVRLRDERLPAPPSSALNNSVTIGMGVSAPGLQNEETSVSALQTWKQPENLSGESDHILPRHRRAVKKYFDRAMP